MKAGERKREESFGKHRDDVKEEERKPQEAGE